MIDRKLQIWVLTDYVPEKYKHVIIYITNEYINCIDSGIDSNRQFYMVDDECHFHIYDNEYYIRNSILHSLNFYYLINEETALFLIKHVLNKIFNKNINKIQLGTSMMFRQINIWYAEKI